MSGTGCDTLVFDLVAAGIKGADRSVAVALRNQTNEELVWEDSGMDHGKRAKLAPDEIAPHSVGYWALESDGWKTGVEGWIEFKVGSGGPTLELKYDNPYIGSNSYGQSVDSNRYKVERSGGDGNNCKVIFTLSYA
ncbi:hypothetical protein F4777DRAFT_384728 [Nemania sp. FL0916]|nr:hypothetical protein F4777DRAFT_384728 [Nemania sp. FL0916]